MEDTSDLNIVHFEQVQKAIGIIKNNPIFESITTDEPLVIDANAAKTDRGTKASREASEAIQRTLPRKMGCLVRCPSKSPWG